MSSSSFSSCALIETSSQKGVWIISAISSLMALNTSKTTLMAFECLDALSAIPATNALVFLPTFVLVISILIGKICSICIRLPDLNFTMFSYALTVLSMPEGLPWRIFFPSKAYLFTISWLLCFKFNQLPWRASKSSAPDKARTTPDTATQKAADDLDWKGKHLHHQAAAWKGSQIFRQPTGEYALYAASSTMLASINH